MSTDEILHRLEGVEGGNGQWTAKCPAHEDGRNSLSIGAGEGGRTVLHCHAGCDKVEILRALGLTLRDLFPASNGHHTANGRKGHGACGKTPNGSPRVIAEYDYRGPNDKIQYQVVRLEPKDFRQRRKNEDGSWNWSLKGVKRFPYRLPEIIRSTPADIAWIVEGERDADNLAAHGLIATCNAGGAGKWEAEWADYFTGRHVVILPDNDEPGRKHAEAVAHSLSKRAASIRVLHLPVDEKGDVSDWLAAGGTIEALKELADERPDWEPEAPPEPPRAFGYMSSAELDAGNFSLTYLIDGILVQGQPAVIAGPKKGVKTGLSIDLTVSLATGGWFLQKLKANKPTRVALISGESGAATIQETARRIAKAKGIPLAEIQNAIWAFDLPTLGDATSEEELRKFVVDQRIEVVIIDPTYLALQVGDDAGNLFKMGGLLKGLSRMAADLGCTPILVHHYRKSVPVGEVPELDWMAWAGLPEWARQWLLLNRREPFDPDGDGEHALWLSVGGSAGHTGLWGIDIHEGTRKTPGGRFWDVELLPAADARSTCSTNNEQAREAAAEAKRTQAEEQRLEKFLAALKRTPEGDTISSIKDRAGLNGNHANRAAEMALERGLVVQCTVDKGKRRDLEALRAVSDKSDKSDKTGPVRVSGSQVDTRTRTGIPPKGEPVLSGYPTLPLEVGR